LEDDTPTVTYCGRWNVTLSEPIEPLTVEEARRRDRTREEWYTVVLGDVTDPNCYLEIAWANDHIGVWFLDDCKRKRVKYSFRKVDDGRMFLQVVTTWTYRKRAGRHLSDASKTEETTYQPLGLATREVTNFRSGGIVREDYLDVPVDNLWEPVPAFGQYRSISRLDRDPVQRVES